MRLEDYNPLDNIQYSVLDLNGKVLKEEDIPETSANDADKGDGDAEIKDMLMPAAAVLLQKVVGHDASEDDAQGKKDPIKTDRKPTDESDILMHGWYSFV